MLGLYLSMMDSDEDKERFTRLYHEYRHLMFYTANEILHDFQLSEDAVQEAFLRIAKNFHKISDVVCPQTKKFTVIVTRNVALTILNKRESAEEIDISDSVSAFSNNDTLFSKVSSDLLMEKMLQLPSKYRDVLYLYHIYGYSFREVAGLIGISSATAKKRAQRARVMLKEMLGEEECRNER